MANYNLVVSSKFSPFTFDEILKPAVMATEAHLKLEELYGELATKASIWDGLIDQNNLEDKGLYDRYLQYSNSIKLAADDLNSKGLNANSRKRLLDLQSRYTKEITPIEKAYTYREKKADELTKLKALDPYMMFDNDFSTMSLSKIINNPTIGYNPVSGTALEKLGMEQAKAASIRKVLPPEVMGLFIAIKHGYGEEAAWNFLKDSKSIPELDKIAEDILNSSGITYENRSRGKQFVINGMVKGLASDIDYKANQNYFSSMDKLNLMSRGINPETLEFDQALWDKYNKYPLEKKLEIKDEANAAKRQQSLLGKGVTFKDNFLIGRYQDPDGKKPWISGISYNIEGGSDNAVKIKLDIVNAMTLSVANNSALVLRYSHDPGHRAYFKIGKPSSDIYNNWFDGNFSADIPMDINRNVVIKEDYMKNLQVVESFDTINSDGGKYDLSNYIIVRVDDSSGQRSKGLNYIAIPRDEMPAYLLNGFQNGMDIDTGLILSTEQEKGAPHSNVNTPSTLNTQPQSSSTQTSESAPVKKLGSGK